MSGRWSGWALKRDVSKRDWTMITILDLIVNIIEETCIYDKLIRILTQIMNYTFI